MTKEKEQIPKASSLSDKFAKLSSPLLIATVLCFAIGFYKGCAKNKTAEKKQAVSIKSDYQKQTLEIGPEWQKITFPKKYRVKINPTELVEMKLTPLGKKYELRPNPNTYDGPHYELVPEVAVFYKRLLVTTLKVPNCEVFVRTKKSAKAKILIAMKPQ